MYLEMELSGCIKNRIYFDYTSASYNKSDADDIDVLIKRTSPAGSENVTFTVTGGKEAGEDYGFGKNYKGDTDYIWTNSDYETNSCTVSFGAGETSKTVTLSIVDNPTLELDRVLTLTLSNPSVGVVIDGTRTITIIDDNIPETDYLGTSYRNIIDVTDPNKKWGETFVTARSGLSALVGDDATDNSEKFGDNTRGIVKWLNDNGGGVLYFPDGTYRLANIGTGRNAMPKQTIVGQSLSGVTIKRSADWLTRLDRYERVLESYDYDQNNDSRPFAVKNITLDGDQPPFIMQLSVVSNPADDANLIIDRTSVIGGSKTYYFRTAGYPNPTDYDIVKGATPADTAATMATQINKAPNFVAFVHPTANTVVLVHAADTANYSKYFSLNVSGSLPAGLTSTTNEWCSLIYFGCDSPSKAGRFVGKFENLVFTKNCTEGIHATSNSDVDIYKVTDGAGGAESFPRGMLDLTGGFSVVKVKNASLKYLHTELDTAGHDGTANNLDRWKIIHKLQDITCEVWSGGLSGLSAPFNSPSSELEVIRVTATIRWDLYGAIGPYAIPSGKVVFTSCDLAFREFGGTWGYPVIYGTGNVTFNDTAFRLGAGSFNQAVAINWFRYDESSSRFRWGGGKTVYLNEFRRPVLHNGYTYEVTAISGGGVTATTGSTEPSWPMTPGNTVSDGSITWTCRAINTGQSNHYGCRAIFNDCKFYNEGSTATRPYAVNSGGSKTGWDLYDNRIQLNRCEQVDGSFYAMIGTTGLGGYFEMVDCIYRGAHLFRLDTGGTGIYQGRYRMVISGGNSKIYTTKFGDIQTCYAGDYLEIKDIGLDLDTYPTQNDWTTGAHSWATIAAAITARNPDANGSMRTIGRTNGPGTGDKGLCGDGGNDFDVWIYGGGTKKCTVMGSGTTWVTVS